MAKARVRGLVGVVLTTLVLILTINTNISAQTQPFSGDVATNHVGAYVTLSPSRLSLDLRDQWSESITRTRFEIGVVALVNRAIRVRYTLVPGFGHQTSTVPSGSFVVGGTEMGKDPAKQGQTKQDKPKFVNLDWNVRPEHRLEAEIMWTICPVKPCVTAEWCHVTLDAATEKDGKQLSAQEEWRRGFVGFGGILQYEITNMRVSVKAVAGKDYSRAEGAILWGVRDDAALSLGYVTESKEPGGVRLREQGPVVGVLILF